MLNQKNILETIEMIDKQHLDIRTVTMGISLRDCARTDVRACCQAVYDKICTKAERLVREAEEALGRNDLEGAESVLKNGAPNLPGQTEEETVPGLPGQEKTEENMDGKGAQGAESAQEALEEGECQTCEERKYQDGSDDMGVSFQTPTRIAPEQAASAVRGHEQEHVVREQDKARREDRRVVSQSVTLHSDICPECGKSYISGGTTRTVTAAQQQEQADTQQQDQQESKGFSVFG